MKRQERAHYFSCKEQELIMKLYEEEKSVLNAKSNTACASKLREKAWQRIADAINESSDSGYKRTWQQVKVKHKNILQTAKRKRVEERRRERAAVPPALTSAEELVLQHNATGLEAELVPAGPCIPPRPGCSNALFEVPGHPVVFLPVPKTERDSPACEDTDVSDGGVVPCSSQDRTDAACEDSVGGDAEVLTEDVKSLYCRYLQKEIENRDQEMAYRALKMRKLEKEILLLDKQLL